MQSGERGVRRTEMVLSKVLWVNLFLMSCGLAEVDARHVLLASNQDWPPRSPFRYVIVNNRTIGRSPRRMDGHRLVEVLLDDKAFSEDNLRELFKRVSRRFPAPRVLSVDVYSSLEDVKTPEEREGAQMSEGPDDPRADTYHRALYLRDNSGNEWFSYNPHPPTRERRWVILKGKDPLGKDTN
jgi:hypothetical protein